MSNYDLPTSLIVNGREYAIRADYRAILDIIGVFTDTGITNEDRALIALTIFYEDFETMPFGAFEDALAKMKWFINGGKEDSRTKNQKLMDWNQDFQLIVSPINKALGFEVRSAEFVHWWTFLSAYMEIGDCLFAQVVSIRKKRKQGKKLDKQDREFYQNNHDIVDLKVEETEAEKALFDEWLT